MVSAGTKRKRRARGNLVAAAIEEGRRQARAEKKALGTTVTPDVPDSALFIVDRKGQTKEEIKRLEFDQILEQKRAAKRARRSAPKTRKSESASVSNEVVEKQGFFAGKKKKTGVSTVEKGILSKRKFDKPEGHVGNISTTRREANKHLDGAEDVWTSEVSKQVSEEVCLNRKRLTSKMNFRQRRAESIIHPSSGMSVNPTYEDHQDKLGEALARIVQKDDLQEWDKKKMSFDPALLDESREGEVADTGMKCDANDTSESESDADEETCNRGAPERKTRAQRHKQTRKKIMAANVAKKRAERRRTEDMERLEQLTREADAESKRLNRTGKNRSKVLLTAPKGQRPTLKKIGGQRVRNELAIDPVPLSEELADNMRGVKMPVANPVLRDRFLSFERRGFVEPPKVLPKEIWRMDKYKQQEAMRDRRKRKGRGSRSNLTFWRNGKRVIQ